MNDLKWESSVPRAQGTAAAEAVAGRSGHDWEGKKNVKWPFGHSLPGLYKR